MMVERVTGEPSLLRHPPDAGGIPDLPLRLHPRWVGILLIIAGVGYGVQNLNAYLFPEPDTRGQRCSGNGG